MIKVEQDDGCKFMDISRYLRLLPDTDLTDDDYARVQREGDWYEQFDKELLGTLKLLAADHMEEALNLFGASVNRQELQALSNNAIIG